jgi:hypothetical protein
MSKDIQQFFSPTHKFAGQPRCRERVFNGFLSRHQCDKRATKDDNTRCGVHCADAKEARKAKRDAKTDAMLKLWDKEHDRRKAQQAILAAVEAALREQAATNDQNPNVTITITHSLARRATATIEKETK